MGLLRIMLALSVVAAHEPTTFFFNFVGGRMAVEIFFVISGFYMQMVMSSQRYASAADFYISRACRIFPAYWLIALVVLLLSSRGWWNHVQQLGPAPAFLIAFSNFALLFQDATLFLTAKDGALAFSSNVFAENTPLFVYLLIPVAWTLALELYFYLLVPFLSKRSTRTLIAIILAASCARVATYLGGLAADPWVYRFFPFEIALFLCGMLAHRFYQRTDWKNFNPKALSIIGWTSVVLFVFSAPLRPPPSIMFFFSMLWACTIPFIFELTHRSTIDRMIGELSYPVYLVHLPLQTHVLPWLKRLPVLNKTPGIIVLSAISILAAILIWWLIDRPVDNWRHRMLTRSARRSTGDLKAATP